jgi:hypothetical protein
MNDVWVDEGWIEEWRAEEGDNGWIDRWMSEQTHWMDGWMDEQTHFSDELSCLFPISMRISSIFLPHTISLCSFFFVINDYFHGNFLLSAKVRHLSKSCCPRSPSTIPSVSMGVWQRVAMDYLKFHLGLPCPIPSMPYEQATPETALWPFQRWPARRPGDLWPSSAPLDTQVPTPYAYVSQDSTASCGEFSLRPDQFFLTTVRNFPCQTLKIRDVSLVVMES